MNQPAVSILLSLALQSPLIFRRCVKEADRQKSSLTYRRKRSKNEIRFEAIKPAGIQPCVRDFYQQSAARCALRRVGRRVLEVYRFKHGRREFYRDDVGGANH